MPARPFNALFSAAVSNLRYLASVVVKCLDRCSSNFGYFKGIKFRGYLISQTSIRHQRVSFFFQRSARNANATLARYNASEFHVHIKTGIYFILHPIIYQNIKTECKN